MEKWKLDFSLCGSLLPLARDSLFLIATSAQTSKTDDESCAVIIGWMCSLAPTLDAYATLIGREFPFLTHG